MMDARGRARIQRQRERKGKKSCRSSRGEVICFDRKREFVLLTRMSSRKRENIIDDDR